MGFIYAASFAVLSQGYALHDSCQREWEARLNLTYWHDNFTDIAEPMTNALDRAFDMVEQVILEMNKTPMIPDIQELLKMLFGPNQADWTRVKRK